MTGEVTRLYSGAFTDTALDPKTGTLALVGSEELPPGLSPGLYSISSTSGAPRLIQAGDWRWIQWSPETERFLAGGPQGVLAAMPGGAVTLFSDRAFPTVSPHGQWLALWGNGIDNTQAGLRLYTPNGKLEQQITTEPVDWVTWRPDSTGLFFLPGKTLYYASVAGDRPVRVDENLQVKQAGLDVGIGWVGWNGSLPPHNYRCSDKDP